MDFPGISLPKKATKELIFRQMWMDSIRTGKERWYPLLLPDLAEYQADLRSEEENQIGQS